MIASTNPIDLSTTLGDRCGTRVSPPNTTLAPPPPIFNSSQVWKFVSAPTLHPMKMRVNSYHPELLGSGLIFNGPYTFSRRATYGQSGVLITDNAGNPIWFRPLGSPSLMNTDVKVQTLYGNPVLTFWQGTIATPPVYTNLPAGGAEPGACYYILNNHYRVIKTVSAFKGFIPDLHEFLITPTNTALFFATAVIPMNLTPYGGPAHGAIHDFSLQEVDLTTNRLLFFWDALDHIPLSSTNMPASTAKFSGNVWDPYHFNSLELINDGSNDILFSARNTSAIYRLSKKTGKLVWTLRGDGKGSISIPDPFAHFAWQHDAHYLSGNIIRMFDDECCAIPGEFPLAIPPSRGLVLFLDLTHGVAKLQTTYYHSPNILTFSQGNDQELENNNQFIGFGSSGYFSEFAKAGNSAITPWLNLLYDVQMPGTNMSYRSYRMAWVGNPDYPPSIVAKSTQHTVVVYASWNGSTKTTSWNVYAGFDPHHLRLVSCANKNGFETTITLSQRWSFFQVRAMDAGGHVLGTSPIVTPSA